MNYCYDVTLLFSPLFFCIRSYSLSQRDRQRRSSTKRLSYWQNTCTGDLIQWNHSCAPAIGACVRRYFSFCCVSEGLSLNMFCFFVLKSLVPLLVLKSIRRCYFVQCRMKQGSHFSVAILVMIFRCMPVLTSPVPHKNIWKLLQFVSWMQYCWKLICKKTNTY